MCIKPASYHTIYYGRMMKIKELFISQKIIGNRIQCRVDFLDKNEAVNSFLRSYGKVEINF